MPKNVLSHMGFTCWVSSDEKKLTTYTEECTGDVKSAWIASEAGKNFSVSWRDASGKRIATSGHVFVDGKDVASAIIRPGRVTPVTRSGVKLRSGKIRPFEFAELTLTDDDTLANRYDTSLRDVGLIRVEISRVRLGAAVAFEGYAAEPHGLVHERAKKAGAHCTTFGEARRVEKGSGRTKTVGVTNAPYDPNAPGPYVTFEFRYRSLDMLKATDIVSNSRKRPNEASEEIEVIEVSSSEDEGPTPSRQPKSQRTKAPESPSKKRVKTEPQADAVPPPPPPPPFGSELQTFANGDSDDERTQVEAPSSQPDNAPQTEEPAAMPQHINQTEQHGNASRDEGNEEVDMAVGEDEDVDHHPLFLPPPSSSPGPDAHALDEDEANID